MARVIKTGLIGAGVFGGYHAGKVAIDSGAQLVCVYDHHPERGLALAAKYNASRAETVQEVVEQCEAVIIATSAPSHFELARAALGAGCHVLVEKPLAMSGTDARELVALAARQNLVLQVGHQERLVCEALGVLNIPERPVRVDLVRAGPRPGNGRALDVSVVWDLMIHDIDLAHRLLGAPAADLAARGQRVIGAELDEVWAEFSIAESKVTAFAGRLASEPKRTMRLCYKSGEIKLDFLARTVENTTEYLVTENLALLADDPLGAADRAFLAACRGEAETPIPGREAANSVVTAETLETLACANLTED